ncbi:MAG: GGDEF domain-containing protein [Aquabacterium sp.]
MSDLIESLAHITGQRDRDLLDRSVLGLLHELLRPQGMAIHRAVGDGQTQRWLTHPRIDAGGGVMAGLPSDAELAPLDAHPERRACLQGSDPIALPGPPHAVLVPLATDREIVGILEITTGAPMPADQRRMLNSLQRFYRHLRGLLDENERDSLTGLLNRKSFDESFLRAAVAGAKPATAGELIYDRREDPDQLTHWLGVVDIDHFKRVNDTHGHLIGDEVLLLLSGLMRSTFRFDDRLYRFGGEEFVVLTRGIPNAAARAMFDRLRSNVERFDFPQVGRLTVSVGYSVIQPNDTPARAIERADQALYFAKTHGRNAACNHADLIATGCLESPDRVGDIELF